MAYNWDQIEEDVRLHRQELTDRLVDFALHDVLLYWSPDEKLQKEQEENWMPILQWADETVLYHDFRYRPGTYVYTGCERILCK